MSMNHNWVQCFDRHLLTNLLNEWQRKMLEKQNAEKAAASRFTNSLSQHGFFDLSRSEHQSKMSSFNVRAFWHKQMFFSTIKPRVELCKGADVVVTSSQKDSAPLRHSKRFIISCHRSFNQMQNLNGIHEAIQTIVRWIWGTRSREAWNQKWPNIFQGTAGIHTYSIYIPKHMCATCGLFRELSMSKAFYHTHCLIHLTFKDLFAAQGFPNNLNPK